MTIFRDPRLRWFIVALTLATFPVVATLAQTTGARLEGTVKDASQAVIPGVTVIATNEATGISHTSLSNETGLYVFVTLPPGPYTLTCELTGFKRYVNKGIVLMIGDTRTINVTLETGDITNEVVVSAAAPMIDVTSGKIGAVVQEQQIADLPILGRQAMMFYYLQAGTNPRDTLGTGLSAQQAVGSVDGLRTNASNVKVDGVMASDAAWDISPASPNVTIPLEAVGEYRVTTSSASADAGRGAGAQVQVVYKSGTNDFHGNVFEFNRNTVYNANNFFLNRAGTPRQVFLRNQYGASLGGPILKNKIFFFGTWEGQRQIMQAILNRNVYSKTLREGTFRYYTKGQNAGTLVDPATGVPKVPAADIKTIDIFNIDPTRLGFDSSGIVAAMLKQVPLPNNYDIGDGFNLAGYRYKDSQPDNYNQFIAKIDQTLSAKHQLSVAIGGFWRDNYYGMMFSGYYGTYYNEKKRNIMIGLVSALTSTLTNEFHAGATFRLEKFTSTDPGNFDHKGNFQLTGLTSGGSGSSGNILAVSLPQDNPLSAFNINDSLAWVVGNHTLKFGLDVVYTARNSKYGGNEYIPTIYTSTANNPSAVPALAGLASADRSRAQQMVNDLTGTIGHINQTYNANSMELGFVPYDTRHRLLRQREWGAFLQDTWKVARNLTLNYGVRWDLLPPVWFANGIGSYPKGGSKAVLGISGPVGTYATDLTPDKGLGIVNWDWNNFGPNLGFTWDPFKDGKMSVSANFRVAYDRQSQSVYGRLEDQNQGMGINLQAIPFTGFSDPNLYQTVGGKPPILPLPPPPRPFFPLPFTREGRAYALDENTRTPYTQLWSLRIQRQLSKDWFVQIAYVGNTSVGGWRAINYNQIEIRKNGFLQGFLAAQRNFIANGNPNKGEPIGVLAEMFAPLGGIPSSQYSNISQGQVATLANYVDTTTASTGTRGGLVTKAGLPITFFRVNPQVLDANIADNLSVSTYHSMKLEVGKRFSGGTYVQFNYTLAKGLTDYVGGQGQYDDFRDNLNRRLDKTLQNYDSTHIVQSNWIWALPFGAGKRWLNSASGWMDSLFGSWQINGIFQLATSRPFTISTGRYNLTLNDASTADFAGKDFNLATKVIKGDNIIAITNEEKLLFTYPPAGSPGGTPQRAFRGPLYSNIDVSMFKNFRARFLGEQGRVQFRAEAFNLLNHSNFGLPDGSIASGTFGQISSAFSARVLQFALKVNF